MARPSRIATQAAQWSHGSPSSPRSRQLMALARMRAVDVLPVPRGPTRRYAWTRRSVATARRRVLTMASWPTTSLKRWARQRRYRARRGPVTGAAGSAAGTVVVSVSGSAGTGVWEPLGMTPLPYTGGGEWVLWPCARLRAPLPAHAPEPGSSQVVPRHSTGIAYRCFLPDLTGFAGRRCVGPDSQRRVPSWEAEVDDLSRDVSPARADCGYRAPLVPRLSTAAADGTGVAERGGFEPPTGCPEPHFQCGAIGL